MAAPDALLVQLARAYQARQLAVRDTTAATVGGLWDRLGGPGDQAAARFVAAAVPVVAGAQAASVSLGIAYVQTYSVAATGEAETLSIDQAALIAGLRGGVPLSEVYQRPVITARAALADGGTLAEALKAARLRAVSTAGTDVMLAARGGTHAAMARAARVVGYRRVPDGAACKFCLLASTQRYHLSQLMPLHQRCGCTVAPIIGTQDPGHVLDKDLVDRLHAADPLIGTRGDNRAWLRQQYESIVAVHEHGELGPVLTARGDHFTGPSDLAA